MADKIIDKAADLPRVPLPVEPVIRKTPRRRRGIPADFLLDVVFTLIPILILIIFRGANGTWRELIFAPDFSYATTVFFGVSIARAQRLRRSIGEGVEETERSITGRQIYLIVLLCVSLLFLFFAISAKAAPAATIQASTSEPSESKYAKYVFFAIQIFLLVVSIVFIWGDYRFRQRIEERRFQRSKQDGLSFCAYANESLRAAWEQVAFAALHVGKIGDVAEFTSPSDDTERKLLLSRALKDLLDGISGAAEMKLNIAAIEDTSQQIKTIGDRLRQK